MKEIIIAVHSANNIENVIIDRQILTEEEPFICQRILNSVYASDDIVYDIWDKTTMEFFPNLWKDHMNEPRYKILHRI